ncbi:MULTISPECIES: site-specific integrase [Nostoc]|uniref:Phage integrase family protein n=1 Tax=Nostoc paludosum FACHB-159 TaxID=2692908 RepID=A0ABR8K5F5_9NOSO|nr:MULTISPECIES: site-specific integrase [Nostoc]MBD2681823.1 phage integrase family protein [Nostoc sp. FACHB-857]MBD2733583.1 phage integrase family protein [Nostoc paludosum FACHB-159]
MNKQRIERHQELTIQEQEYLKDTWDVRVFGVTPRIGAYEYKISFKKIQQLWLKSIAKAYAKYALTVLSFGTVSHTMTVVNLLSAFINERYTSLQANQIERQFIVNFLGYLAEIYPNTGTRNTRISLLNSFLEICQREKWLGINNEILIHKEDYPSIPKYVPKYIPKEVLDQLNEHLNTLPKQVARMVILLQSTGIRVSELCQLRFDCIAQDTKGGWWFTYFQFKLKKEHNIPISTEIAEVIQQQQSYITEELDPKFPYLFCARKKGSEIFIPALKPMSYLTLRRYLKKLALEKNICDASGNIFPLERVHRFRHTVGTNMINNGVPIHIIKRFFGHESFRMTERYAHIHDETIKQAIDEYYGGKVVNITGEVVISKRPELDTGDMQWFKKNIQAQALANGYCGLPKTLDDCPHANACLTCGHFRTTKEFLVVHKQELENTNKIIEKAKANGWERQLEMNEKVKRNLEKIISSLESESGK